MAKKVYRAQPKRNAVYKKHMAPKKVHTGRKTLLSDARKRGARRTQIKRRGEVASVGWSSNTGRKPYGVKRRKNFLKSKLGMHAVYPANRVSVQARKDKKKGIAGKTKYPNYDVYKNR